VYLRTRMVFKPHLRHVDVHHFYALCNGGRICRIAVCHWLVSVKSILIFFHVIPLSSSSSSSSQLAMLSTTDYSVCNATNIAPRRLLPLLQSLLPRQSLAVALVVAVTVVAVVLRAPAGLRWVTMTTRRSRSRGRRAARCTSTWRWTGTPARRAPPPAMTSRRRAMTSSAARAVTSRRRRRPMRSRASTAGTAARWRHRPTRRHSTQTMMMTMMIRVMKTMRSRSSQTRSADPAAAAATTTPPQWPWTSVTVSQYSIYWPTPHASPTFEPRQRAMSNVSDVARGLKTRKGRSFSTDRSKFLLLKIAQNFNFDHTFLQNLVFYSHNFVFLDKYLSIKNFRQEKIRGLGQFPSCILCTMPLNWLHSVEAIGAKVLAVMRSRKAKPRSVGIRGMSPQKHLIALFLS